MSPFWLIASEWDAARAKGSERLYCQVAFFPSFFYYCYHFSFFVSFLCACARCLTVLLNWKKRKGEWHLLLSAVCALPSSPPFASSMCGRGHLPTGLSTFVLTFLCFHALFNSRAYFTVRKFRLSWDLGVWCKCRVQGHSVYPLSGSAVKWVIEQSTNFSFFSLFFPPLYLTFCFSVSCSRAIADFQCLFPFHIRFRAPEHIHTNDKKTPFFFFTVRLRKSPWHLSLR